jgi:hypothetical protein
VSIGLREIVRRQRRTLQGSTDGARRVGPRSAGAWAFEKMCAVDAGVTVAWFVEDSGASDWLHGQLGESIQASIGDAEAVAAASYEADEDGSPSRALVACTSTGQWVVITLNPDATRTTEITARLGVLDGVAIREWRVHEAHDPRMVMSRLDGFDLLHPRFPGGELRVDMTKRRGRRDDLEMLLKAFRLAAGLA